MDTPEELARLINLAIDAVDRSSLGPLFVYPDPGNIMNKQVNQLAFGVFTIVLQGLLRYPPE
jgi:hypothetical protein